MQPQQICRHCHSDKIENMLDLGFAPPSNEYLSVESLKAPEVTFPLRLGVCTNCWLVQTEDFSKADELFKSDYAYFSSTSKSWLKHAKDYAEMISKRFNLNNNSFVMELASNDGYLLNNFKERGIPCLGVEPTDSTAKKAEEQGIEVIRDFFGTSLAVEISNKYGLCDLIIGNNVYAHVPDINDFTKGISKCLKIDGVLTLEFPHLLNLLRFNQFDTVYHEHFSYLSLHTVSSIFEKYGLKVFDVEELSTHGGSIRVYGCHKDASHKISKNVKNTLEMEYEFGLRKIETYLKLQENALSIKYELNKFLIDAKLSGKHVVGYGAAAKGNTLLNFSGIHKDLIEAVYDAAESKQNKYLPGSHIPIYPPSHLKNLNPDYVIIFPWNIKSEIKHQLSFLAEKGTKFVSFIPEMSFV